MQPNKPLATLGDVVDWRAQLRAEDVPIRTPRYAPPPPSSRPTSQLGPDRGFVEQPEERVQTRTIPTPEQQTLVRLERDARQVPLPIRPAPESPAPEAAEMPKAKTRNVTTPEYRARVVAWVLKDGKPGAQARAAQHYGIHESSVSQWVRHRKTAGAAPASSTKTLVSSPESAPASGVVPAQLTVSIPGLEAHIRALVAVEVAAQLKARLRGLMSD